MSKLTQLEERKAKLEEEIKQLKRKEAEEKRKQDTRRKILVGAFILNEVDLGRMDMAELTRQLDDYLKADKDRKLFDLPTRAAEGTPEVAREVTGVS